MRAKLILLLAAMAIPLAFVSPLIGLCAYSVLAYMRPQDLAWGIGHISFGLYVALALFAGLAARMKLDFFKLSPVTISLLALWGWYALSAHTALDPWVARRDGLEHISKIFLICLVTTGLCVDRKSIEWIIMAIAGGLAFHGCKMGVFGLMHPGVRMNSPIGGMISGNNENAIALNFALPFCVYFAMNARSFGKRWGWWVTSGLTVVAVIFTYSRGGFLGTVAAGCVIVWNTRARAFALGVVAPVVVAAFFALAPTQYVERVRGINEARDADMSAVRRLQAWNVAWTITKTHPFLGIGPRMFPDKFRRFPHPHDMPRMEIHNTYLEFSASSGIPALLLYFLFVGSAWRACSRVRRDARARNDPRLDWYVSTSQAVQASMASFVVSSTFGSLMHFDLMYHVCAIAACLPVAYRKEVAGIETTDAYTRLSVDVLPTASDLPEISFGPVIEERRSLHADAPLSVSTGTSETAAERESLPRTSGPARPPDRPWSTGRGREAGE